MMDILSYSKPLSLLLGGSITIMNVNTHFEPLTSGMKARIETRCQAAANHVPDRFSVRLPLITAKKRGSIFAKLTNHHVTPYRL